MKKSLVVLMAAAVFMAMMAVPVFAADKLIVKDAGGTNTVFVVQDTGNTGVQTATPSAKLQIGNVTPPNIGTPWDLYTYNASFGRVAIDSGVANAGLEFLEATTRKWFMGSFNGKFGVYHTPSNSWKLAIDTAGKVGIGTLNPAFPLQVGTNGTNGNGAYLSAGGVWTDGSSREFKDNIEALSTEKAFDTLLKLDPVTYHSKNDPSEKHVGFIAEDVPDLVATPDRRHLSPMDIVAILTKVVQEQNRTIEALSIKLDRLEKATTK